MAERVYKGKINLRGPSSHIAKVISLVIGLACAVIMKILCLSVPAELIELTALSNPVLHSCETTAATKNNRMVHSFIFP